MDQYEAIRLRALVDVENGDDYDYIQRRIGRFISKEFHVPLHLIDEVFTFEEQLRTYWEANFETMSSEDRYIQIDRLSMAPEEKVELAVKKEVEDDVAIAKLTQAIKTKAVLKKKGPPESLLRLLDGMDMLKPGNISIKQKK